MTDKIEPAPTKPASARVCAECGKPCVIFTHIDGEIVCALCVARAMP